MPIVDRDEAPDGTIYTVEVTSKNKPDLGIVDNEARAERKARTALLVRRRTIPEDELELRDIQELRRNEFTLRSDYKVTFFLPNN